MGTTLPHRSPGAPEIPTLAEAGLPKFSVSLWAGIYGPPGLPAVIVERLNKEITIILNKSDIKEKLESQQFFPQASSAKELQNITTEQLMIYSKTLKEAGVQAE
jgi:tripartite-type tricarboxylate transporter receptor subunit TctC